MLTVLNLTMTCWHQYLRWQNHADISTYFVTLAMNCWDQYLRWQTMLTSVLTLLLWLWTADISTYFVTLAVTCWDQYLLWHDMVTSVLTLFLWLWPAEISTYFDMTWWHKYLLIDKLTLLLTLAVPILMTRSQVTHMTTTWERTIRGSPRISHTYDPLRLCDTIQQPIIQVLNDISFCTVNVPVHWSTEHHKTRINHKTLLNIYMYVYLLQFGHDLCFHDLTLCCIQWKS